MFSTIPFGDTPVSNSNVRLRPAFSIRTSAENPGSAISASGTPVVGLTRAWVFGSPPRIAFGQFIRVIASWSDQQRVGHVVHQQRDLHAVDGLELDAVHRVILSLAIARCYLPRSAGPWASTPAGAEL